MPQAEELNPENGNTEDKTNDFSINPGPEE